MNSPSLQTQHHPLADLPEPDLPESPTTPPPAPTTSRPKFLSWWKTPVPPSPRTPTPLRIWIPRKSSENPKPTSCSPESRAKALLDIIARPVNGQGRVSRTIRLHCSAWTRPLWETPGIADSTLMDATLQEKNIWAWQLCDVLQNHLSRGANAVALGPLSWVDAWSDEYVHLLDTLSESEVERFSRWFSEEFYPNHNFWRARIGWPAPTSLFAQPSVAIDWRGKTPSQTPREPQPWYTVTLSHPPVEHWRTRPTDYTTTYSKQLTAEMRAWPHGEIDPSPLIQMYWVQRKWEWEWSICDTSSTDSSEIDRQAFAQPL